MVPPEVAMAPKMTPFEPTVPAKPVIPPTVPAPASDDDLAAPCRPGVAPSQKGICFGAPTFGNTPVASIAQTQRMNRSGRNLN
jgi:hypothetical protein